MNKRKCDQSRRRNTIEKYHKSPNICLYCGEIMELKDGVRPCDLKKKKFCSRSHAASYNNSLHIKRVRMGPKPTCRRCGKEVSGDTIICKPCLTQEHFERAWSLPMGKYLRRTASRAKYSAVRTWSKKYLDTLKIPKHCCVCGYGKIVEVSHIKPLSSFSEDTLMSVVNHKDNLRYLCPNHHAEFDRGLLTFEKGERKEGLR